MPAKTRKAKNTGNSKEKKKRASGLRKAEQRVSEGHATPFVCYRGLRDALKWAVFGMAAMAHGGHGEHGASVSMGQAGRGGLSLGAWVLGWVGMRGAPRAGMPPS